MTSINLMLTGAQAWAVATGPLTSGMVGIPITIECDESWNGLTKNLMCRCSPWESTDGEYRAILNVGETATVSHEVMLPDMYLYLGVEGYSDDGKLVIPTTWARCGKIEYGANTCDDPSTDPELPVWNQLQIEMEKTKEYVLTPEQAVNIQSYAQTATRAAEEAQQAAEEAKQAVERGLFFIPVVSQPTETTLKFEFKPSLTGAPIPKPVTVELPVGSGTGGGLTTVQINALHGMFKVCLFDDSKDVDGAISAFEAAFGITGGGETPEEPDVPDTTVYTIAYELVNAISSNRTATVKEGGAYTATLTAAEGYTMEGATVTVTMGGVDVTADVYANGVISIPAVTGNVEIMASAVQVEQEVEAALPEDGLAGYWDLRNYEWVGNTASPVKGNDSNIVIADTSSGDRTDVTAAGMLFTAGNWRVLTPKTIAEGEATLSTKNHGSEFTVGLFSYAVAKGGILAISNFTAAKNQTPFIVNLRYYNTSGTAAATSVYYGPDNLTSGKFHSFVYWVSGTRAKILLNGEVVLDVDGSTLADFDYWDRKFTYETAAIYASKQTRITAIADYDKALSEVELVELENFFRTLEVIE